VGGEGVVGERASTDAVACLEDDGVMAGGRSGTSGSDTRSACTDDSDSHSDSASVRGRMIVAEASRQDSRMFALALRR
jgi:hypothetical protein